MYENINKFIIHISNQKVFRELPEQYKSIKFCKLYYRIYSYMLSIPKEKIVIGCFVDSTERHYISNIMRIVSKFIEAKDFYNWKERIYNLLSEKLSATSKRKYELLYGSKYKEFYNNIQKKFKTTCLEKYGKEYYTQTKECKNKIKTTNLKRCGKEYYTQTKECQDKRKVTCLKNYGKENPSQVKEIQDKISNSHKNRSKEKINKSNEKRKATCLKNYGKENPSQVKELQDKRKATCLKNYGKENPSQVKELQEKKKATCLERYGYEYASQSKEIQDKIKATCMKNHGIKYGICLAKHNSHSKFGNEVCIAIDNLLGNPEDSIYYIKSGYEYCIHTDTKTYYIDMVIPSLGLAFEADGVYFHGLMEGQEYVFNTPVEEIWKYDREKTIAIEKAGYKLFRIREDEWKLNNNKCLENLLKEIKRVSKNENS